MYNFNTKIMWNINEEHITQFSTQWFQAWDICVVNAKVNPSGRPLVLVAKGQRGRFRAPQSSVPNNTPPGDHL